MKNLRIGLIVVAVVGLAATVPAGRAQGLYGDEGKKAVGGDLNDQDYWWSKYDLMMMDLAIKQHQPEGRIGVDLASTIRRLDDLVKKYPQHKGIADMKARAEAVEAKINPNASRQVYFSKECPWDESNFAQLWVNMHWAKSALDVKDYNTAFSCMQNVLQNYDIMMKPDRMKDYPEELRKYVTDNKPEADRMYKLAKDKK